MISYLWHELEALEELGRSIVSRSAAFCHLTQPPGTDPMFPVAPLPGKVPRHGKYNVATAAEDVEMSPRRCQL